MGKVLSNNERILFCEQMGMILKSGISAAEGIMIMKEDAGEEESSLRELYGEIQSNLEETGVFYDALEETGAFPDYMIQMTRIGEQTGNLDEVMEGLAAYYEREENMVQDIKSAVTYPLLMLGMMVVIFLVMIVKVLPVFAQVYEQLGGQMTGMAAVLLRAGAGIRQYYGWILLVIALLAAGGIWLFGTAKGKDCFRNMAGRFFGTRQIMTRMQTARFASGMSMALRSGMDYDGAFQMVESLLSADQSVKRKLDSCREKVENGESFSAAAVQAGLLTGLYGRMLYIAERTGDTDGALKKIALQADSEVTARIQNFISVLEPTLVAVLSVLVGGILLSVMVPLMGILSSIG